MRCPKATFPISPPATSAIVRAAGADLKKLIDKTQFAISTEETRYYLNGIFMHTIDVDGHVMLRAVATDGHRLARVEMPAPAGAAGMPGVIVPRKAVAEVQKLIEDASARSHRRALDGQGALHGRRRRADLQADRRHLPRLRRVIPTGNDKRLTVERDQFAEAVDRVSTISSERGRAVKLALADGKLALSVTNPDSGSATEEIEVDYDSGPLDIGFNARYLLDITATARQRHGSVQARRPRLADPGAGSRRRRRALCADADARLILRLGRFAGMKQAP
jgi:DNA polymerase-3 subunit beta